MGTALRLDPSDIQKPVALGSQVSVKAMTYLDWVKTTNSFLSLDISVRGTGYTLWRDGVLTFGRKTLEATDEVSRVEEFKSWLLEIIDGYNFEYFFVEDVIASCNFKTVRALISLNNALDTLIYEKKVLPPVQLFRESNKVWKKNLKGTAGNDIIIKGEAYTNGDDKECTKACLQSLGVDIEALKQGIYTDKQVEDICDSLGLAIGTIAVGIQKAPVVKSKTISTDIRKGYTIKQFDTLDDALKSAERCSKKGTKPIVTLDLASEPDNDLVRFMSKQIPDEPHAIFVVHAPVSKCCNVLLLKRLETAKADYYLTITK